MGGVETTVLHLFFFMPLPNIPFLLSLFPVKWKKGKLIIKFQVPSSKFQVPSFKFKVKSSK